MGGEGRRAKKQHAPASPVVAFALAGAPGLKQAMYAMEQQLHGLLVVCAVQKCARQCRIVVSYISITIIDTRAWRSKRTTRPRAGALRGLSEKRMRAAGKPRGGGERLPTGR